MKDRHLQENFGKAGRKRAEEKFSWLAIAEETKRLYAEVCRRSTSRS
jgi:glycosyltransferase involved in cell wall biosynthesis